MGDQITKYINEEIRHGKDVKVKAYGKDNKPIELTISKDTAGKAAYWNTDQSGNPVSAKEYALKLRIESHIDEAAEVSIGKGGKSPDEKNHLFAKDGWNYRRAYFEDFDGKYYSFQISVGKDGKVNTIYNVNEIKEEAGTPNTLKGAQPQKRPSGPASSESSIPKAGEEVNKKVFSLSEESAPNVTEEAELYAQSRSDKDMEAALMPVKRLHDTAMKGAGYLTREEAPAIQKGDWQKRIAEIRDRLLLETGNFRQRESLHAEDATDQENG